MKMFSLLLKKKLEEETEKKRKEKEEKVGFRAGLCSVVITIREQYPASRGVFMASLLAWTKSFASYISCSRLEVNKPTTRKTRDANNFVHTKRLAGKKPLLAREGTVIKQRNVNF